MMKEFNLKRVEDEKNFKVRQEAFHTKENSVELSLSKKNNDQEKCQLQIKEKRNKYSN